MEHLLFEELRATNQEVITPRQLPWEPGYWWQGLGEQRQLRAQLFRAVVITEGWTGGLPWVGSLPIGSDFLNDRAKRWVGISCLIK